MRLGHCQQLLGCNFLDASPIWSPRALGQANTHMALPHPTPLNIRLGTKCKTAVDC